MVAAVRPVGALEIWCRPTTRSPGCSGVGSWRWPPASVPLAPWSNSGPAASPWSVETIGQPGYGPAGPAGAQVIVIEVDAATWFVL